LISIAHVQGCYMITSSTVMPLDNLSHYDNAVPEIKLVNGKLEEISHGTIKITLKETREVYHKPYLYYEMECEKSFGMNLVRNVLVF
jgi:hypothetical protein